MAKERYRVQKVREARSRASRSLATLAFFMVVPMVGLAATVPAHFQAYAKTDIGDGLSCVVGATAKPGETSDEHAYVYLEEGASHKIRWVTSVPVHPGWYQNRASHCVAAGDRIYALIQSDTKSVPVVSQTFISVAVLDKKMGHVESDELVKATNTPGAHTVFVYDGAENFQENAGTITVKGEFASKGDATDTRTPFTATVPVTH